MAKKSKSMIGHDPLAWLKDDAEDAEIIEEVKEEPAKPKKKAAKKAAPKAEEKAQPVEEQTDDADGHVFEIQSVQDISSVAGLHDELKSLFKHEKVILDGSNVDRIDAASLQLLFAFIQEAKINEVDVAWRSPSEAMTRSVNLLGMEEALQLGNVA